MLTDLQRVVLAQLRQRNCVLIAEQAEHCWRQGQRSYFDARARCPRWLRQLFFEANDETITALPKIAEASASELFAWRPRQRRAAKMYEWKIVPVRACPAPDELMRCIRLPRRLITGAPMSPPRRLSARSASVWRRCC